jgi:hypothetical protein
MKKFYLPIFMGMVSLFFSCIPSPSKMIIGEWKMRKIKVKSVDSIVNNKLSEQIINRNIYIKRIDSLMLRTSSDGKIKLMNERILIIKYLKDNLKDEIELEKEKIVYRIRFEFKNDNTYNYADSSYSVFEKGHWRISDNLRNLILKPEKEEEEIYNIHEIRSNELFIERERKIGEFTIPFYMYFYR